MRENYSSESSSCGCHSTHVSFCHLRWQRTYYDHVLLGTLSNRNPSIAPLVDATLNTLDDAILPAANCVLEVLDTKDDLEAATDIKITTEGITFFQDQVAKPFITMLKNNILSQFVSQDVVSSFIIFGPKKVPAADSSGLLSYGEDSMDLLIEHYGADHPAETVQGDEYTKEAVISPELRTE